MIVPSIDIQEGKVVQLRQGREKVWTDSRSPEELARYFGRFGPVAVIDLDAAMGDGNNMDLVSSCCKVAECRVGGGIRTKEDVLKWIRRGAQKVIVGTSATPEFLSQFPREWMIAAVDALHGEVVVNGWKRSKGTQVEETALSLAPFCSEILFTCVEREGMLDGADIDRALSLRQQLDVPLIVAGGVASIGEISKLVGGGCYVQLGRAIYEEKIDLADAWIEQVAFDAGGLVPTIVQDDGTREVRMVGYSSKESLKLALQGAEGWYFSRSRKELWRKGATSGNTQQLINARWDCDQDAVLFRVVQRGPTCHTGIRTCFGDSRSDVIDKLFATIQSRKEGNGRKSYTKRLLDDPSLVTAKMREEIEEVIDAECEDDVAWEAADVLYHLLVRCCSKGVTWDRVCTELRSRMRS